MTSQTSSNYKRPEDQQVESPVTGIPRISEIMHSSMGKTIQRPPRVATNEGYLTKWSEDYRIAPREPTHLENYQSATMYEDQLDTLKIGPSPIIRCPTCLSFLVKSLLDSPHSHCPMCQ